jgi:hypothetical protein
MVLPDPASEIRLLSVRTLRGASFWSLGPVTRADVVPGAYDEISSAELPGFVDALLAALPGLWEHRCSVGEPGGFVARLRRGTYPPHVMEHVALELQSLAGHEVGYGRARGGERPGEYTVVVEHRHAAVGARAAELAVEVVRGACAGTLGCLAEAGAELRALAETPDAPRPGRTVACGVTGGGGVEAVRRALLRRRPDAEVVAVPPRALLEEGLPYRRSRAAVILDAAPPDVPARYLEDGRGASLVGVLADAVEPGGVVVAPATEWEVQSLARDAGCRVAVFSADGAVTGRALRLAHAAAGVRDGRMVVDTGGEMADAGPLDRAAAPGPQLAAVLAAGALGWG